MTNEHHLNQSANIWAKASCLGNYAFTDRSTYNKIACRNTHGGKIHYYKWLEKICEKKCPLQVMCLEYALDLLKDNANLNGIWGGTTISEEVKTVQAKRNKLVKKLNQLKIGKL